jgi:hypothetical protein
MCAVGIFLIELPSTKTEKCTLVVHRGRRIKNEAQILVGNADDFHY